MFDRINEMSDEELFDFLERRNKVNTKLKRLSQLACAAFCLAMLAAIWFVVELALLVN